MHRLYMYTEALSAVNELSLLCVTFSSSVCLQHYAYVWTIKQSSVYRDGSLLVYL